MTMARTVSEEFQHIPIDRVLESPKNPRRAFSEEHLKQLAASILEKGIVEPLVVRPNGTPGTFELVAGARRLRAAKAAGLGSVPAVVRPYSDDQVLELMLVENIQRQDLTPLEQARGYRALITSNPTKHSAETIASKIGMSVAYVWDRLKLNDLIPSAQRLLDAERFTVGHAILIARQTPEHQARIIAPPDRSWNSDRHSALWRHEASLPLEDEAAEKAAKKDPYHGLKPVSVRELDHWIADHIRFDIAHAAQAQPLEFEGTAAQVAAATAQPGRGRKVVAITHEYRVADDARADERTYGREAWRRADGQEKSKTCEYSVLGVVVAGDGRGDTLQVCVNRDKCEVHFGKEIRDRAKNQKLRAAGKGKTADKREATAAGRERQEQAKREAAEARWKVFLPALTKLVLAASDKLPEKLPAPLFARLLQAERLPGKTTQAGFVRAVLLARLREEFSSWVWLGNEPKLREWAKLLGVDPSRCEPPVTAAATEVAAATKPTPKAKKAGKR